MEQLKAEVGPMEYFDAFKVARCGKNLLMAIILLSILVQLAGAILVEFTGLLEEAAPPAAKAAASAPAATGPATAPAGLPLRATAFWLLPAVKFTALAASLLLMLILIFLVQLSLVGRLGGAAGFMRAFFLSLILLAMLVPWQQIMNSAFACGALFNLGQLEEARRQLQDDKFSQILHYARFIAYPSLALLVLIAVQIAFGKGCKRMNVPPAIMVSNRPESP
jgi:hypothetical protein